MSKWYNKYENIPYKHLGLDIENGIDCFNLIRHIYREELGINIPYTTRDFCEDDEEDWYQKPNNNPILLAATEKYGWETISKSYSGWSENMQLYDVILMSIGSTNCINHCSLVVDTEGKRKKLLHIMEDYKKSWIAPYGFTYIDMTEGIRRWKNLKI